MDNDEVIKNNNLSNISMLNMVGVSPTSNVDDNFVLVMRSISRQTGGDFFPLPQCTLSFQKRVVERTTHPNCSSNSIDTDILKGIVDKIGSNAITANKTDLISVLTREANLLDIKTIRGAANVIVASPKVVKLLTNEDHSFNDNAIDKIGLICDDKYLLLQDNTATTDYLILGYRGKQNGDAGVIFCPYIPGQSSNENDIPETYGILYDECDKFYTMINVSGL